MGSCSACILRFMLCLVTGNACITGGIAAFCLFALMTDDTDPGIGAIYYLVYMMMFFYLTVAVLVAAPLIWVVFIVIFAYCVPWLKSCRSRLRGQMSPLR